MKKLLAVMLCIGLLSNSVNAISSLRVWQCRPTNPQSDCSLAEQDASKKVFKTATMTTLGALAAILTALGVAAVTLSLLKREKEAAIQSGSTLREQMQAAIQRKKEEEMPTSPMTEQERIKATMQTAQELQKAVAAQPMPQVLIEQAKEELLTVKQRLIKLQQQQTAIDQEIHRVLTSGPRFMTDQESMEMHKKLKDLTKQKNEITIQIYKLREL